MAAPMKTDSAKDAPNKLKYSPAIVPDKEFLKFYLARTTDCSFYKTEYEDCCSWRGQMNNKYIYGRELQCDHYKDAYDVCEKWRTTRNEELLDYMVKFEAARAAHRLKYARENDVWEYRTKPPSDWMMPVNFVKDNVKKDVNYKSYFEIEDSGDQNLNFNASDSEPGSNEKQGVKGDNLTVHSSDEDEKKTTNGNSPKGGENSVSNQGRRCVIC